MRDKKWLKDEVARIYDARDYWSVDDLKDEILDSINELDEPEVLSQEWIDEYVHYEDVRGYVLEFIHVDNLQNLLVPKQELPVVPKFVADWIEDLKSKKLNILESIYDFTHGEDIHDYIRKQGNTLMRAWLDGYTVESEQRYYAKIKGHELLSDKEDSYWSVDRKELFIDNIWHDYSGYKTTKLTRYDWNNLGINEDNADFVKAEEVE